MNISNILMGVQVVLAIVLILSIMPQDTKSAVPSQYGGEGNQSYFKPKGKEAFLGRVTKIAAVLFFINAISDNLPSSFNFASFNYSPTTINGTGLVE